MHVEDAVDPNTRPVQPSPGPVDQPSQVDVSASARAIALALTVKVDAEAFGVTVTRRPGANEHNLAGSERVRLLGLLAEVKDLLMKCDAQESDAQEKQFPIWVVSSDARDAKPRMLWLEIRAQANGYAIGLTDQ